jgi:hypothetical protein
MLWVMPLVFGTMFMGVLAIWNLMLGRWSINDWKELAFSGLLATVLIYLVFFGAVVFRHWSGPKIPVPVIGITGAGILVYVAGRFRRRLDRRENVETRSDS